MMIVTTPTIAGKRITVTHGLVRGNTIRARHVGSDIGALLKNLVGGEIRAYAKLLEDSREEALQRMMEDALALGANAVVSVRIATSVVMGGAAEMLAYGTAVTVENE
ncbi:MAG: YbjQ family protein [Rhodothermales bacterium]|nr:YbjQ family protein [Rhodothermales bacterium]